MPQPILEFQLARIHRADPGSDRETRMRMRTIGRDA